MSEQQVTLNFSNTKGLVNDLHASQLGLKEVSFASNVEITLNGFQRTKGWKQVFGDAPASFTNASVMPWLRNNFCFWFVATDSKIYRVYAPDTWDDVTAIAGDYEAPAGTTWSGSIFNEVPIMNNDGGVDIPQMWATGKFQDLTAWPASTFCKIIRGYKNVLVALNVTKGATNYPMLIKISSIADPGTVPASWDHTDPAYLTWEGPLATGSGAIIQGYELGDIFVIYKENSVHGLQFQQSVDFPYRTWTIFPEFSLLGPQAVCQFGNGAHFTLTREDLYLHTGAGMPQGLLDGRTRNWLYDNINATYSDRTVLRYDYRQNELHIAFVPLSSDVTWPTISLVYSTTTSSFSLRDMPGVSDAGPGMIQDVVVQGVIDDDDRIINEVSDRMGALPYSGIRKDMILVSPENGKLFQLNQTEQQDGVDFDGYIERISLPLGRDAQGLPMLDPISDKVFHAVWPHIISSSPVNVQFGMQDYVDGPVNWGPIQQHDPQNARFLHIDTPGRYVCYRVGQGSNVAWMLTGFTFTIDIAPGGVT